MKIVKPSRQQRAKRQGQLRRDGSLQLRLDPIIGRALRRQSYDLNEEGLFNVEYADILGVPFDFTAKPVVAELPEERLSATFNDDSVLVLTPELVGPSITTSQGIIGEGVDLNLIHTVTCVIRRCYFM
jgi:type III restriction enzyme